MNELALQKTSMIFDVEKMNAVNNFANMMAGSKVSVPDHLKGSPSDCMAICLQSIAWGMDPFAVAQKTHLVQGRLGYEAQLVSAVISSSTAIVGGFKYEFGGDWEQLYQYPPMTKTSKAGKPYLAKGWPHESEKGLWCRCGAVLKGESEITWGEKVYLQSIATRNSTNWVNDPKQQMAYTAQKRWSRLYAPAVILGVYTSDEIDMGHAVVVEEPKAKSSTLAALVSKSEKDVVDVVTQSADILAHAGQSAAQPKTEDSAGEKHFSTALSMVAGVQSIPDADAMAERVRQGKKLTADQTEKVLAALEERKEQIESEILGMF